MIPLDIVVGLLVLSLIIISSFVLARSARSNVNKTFAGFVLISAIWITANFIGANYQKYYFSAFFRHADFFTGDFLALFLWIFTITLYSRLTGLFLYKIQRRLIIPLCLLTVLNSILTLTPNIIQTKDIPGKVQLIYGTKFFIYIALTLLPLVLSVINLIVVFLKTTGIDRRRISTMLSGLAFAILIVAGANLILPAITKAAYINLIVGNLAYIGIAVYIFATTYAIVVHKLFDIGLVVARTVAYVFSLASLGIVFTGITFIISGVLFNGSHWSLTRLRLVYAIIAVLLAITFPRLKRFFDTLTNRLFFRDSYNVQTFLDHLNKTLVSEYELEPLLKEVSILIEENIKPTFCLFGLNEVGRKELRILGNTKREVLELERLRQLAPKSGQKIITTDLLEAKDSSLQRTLQNNKIAVIARLTASNHEEDIGYLILGTKKSGNIYNNQDTRVIEIIANELFVAIQNAMHTEEIERFNITLQERIRDATHRLRKINDKLRALDEAKDDFVSMASHQLRTPLTSVKGNISLVLDGDAGKISGLQRQLLDQAFASSQRMVYLIADLLNVSRLKTGKFIIERAPVDLSTVIDEEVNQLIETANSRHLTLSYDKPEHITPLMLDDTKTRQVIMNFIDNAIYYTPSGGKIDVILSETPSAVECRVKDNGIGVPKAEQHHLFTKFYRAGNARKARPDGTGLGLFMAKKVIASEGGAIIFETQEGKGSTFGFSFPKAALAVDSFAATPTPDKTPLATATK